jgi:hypothetical protein
VDVIQGNVITMTFEKDNTMVITFGKMEREHAFNKYIGKQQHR